MGVAQVVVYTSRAMLQHQFEAGFKQMRQMSPKKFGLDFKQ